MAVQIGATGNGVVFLIALSIGLQVALVVAFFYMASNIAVIRRVAERTEQSATALGSVWRLKDRWRSPRSMGRPRLLRTETESNADEPICPLFARGLHLVGRSTDDEVNCNTCSSLIRIPPNA